MRELLIVLALFCSISVWAQEKDSKGKMVKFSNITEFTLGFQVGKTTKVTSVPAGEEGTFKIAGYKFPSPRISSSFGALFGDIFFLGPGFAYSYQPGDKNASSLAANMESDKNPRQHHLAALLHARIHFAKGRFRPYTELKGGYNHIFTEEVSSSYSEDAFTYDGIFIEPALGFGVKLGQHGQLNLSLGYQFMNVWNRSDGFTDLSQFEPELKDSYHRLLISLGFSFY